MDTSWHVTFTSPDGLRSYASRPRGPTQLALQKTPRLTGEEIVDG